MIILALMGSYRKRGNTARMVEMIEVEMEALAVRWPVCDLEGG